jgi:hypothetical protein
MNSDIAHWLVVEDTTEGQRVVEAYTDAELNAMQAINANPSGVCIDLATLPVNAQLDMHALAKIFKRSKKSIQRAIRRGDLPKPFRMMGKCVWLAGVIIDHFVEKQKAALQLDEKRKERLSRHVA